MFSAIDTVGCAPGKTVRSNRVIWLTTKLTKNEILVEEKRPTCQEQESSARKDMAASVRDSLIQHATQFTVNALRLQVGCQIKESRH